MLVRWKKASILTFEGQVRRSTIGRSFLVVCAEPLAQRNCWPLKLFISQGSSAGDDGVGTYTNCQPRDLRAVARGPCPR